MSTSLALGSHSLLVERPQATDYIGRPISILFDSGSRRAGCFPDRAGFRASHLKHALALVMEAAIGLPDFVSQCSGLSFAHHIDAIDVCEISLQLTQLFAFLFGVLPFGDIHRDADVVAHFYRRIVMPYGAQKSNAAIGKTNPKLADIVIRSCSNRILKSLGHSGSIFLMNAVEETLEWR